MLIDSHCHLNFENFKDDIDEVLLRANSNNVEVMLCVCTMLEDLPSIINITAKKNKIFSSVGIHPCNINDVVPDLSLQLVALSQNPKIIALGETGLDFSHINFDKEAQINAFIQHITCSQETNLPVIVHTRQASSDTLTVIKQQLNVKEYCGVIHCFTESWEFAKKALDMGFYISFSGIVTFKNAIDLQEVAKKIPLDRMLIETDAPYLAPMPFRGKRNEPSYLSSTAAFLANLKNVNYDVFCQTTTDNFYRLFNKATI